MLSAVRAEVSSQAQALEAYLAERVAPAPAGSICVGAGDSFVAASVAARLSPTKVFAFTPYDLMADPSASRGRHVYFVSASGRTKANVAAARSMKGVAARTFAVTSDPGGPLSRATDSTLALPCKVVPRTPGTLSFTLALLALVKLTTTSPACDFEGAFALAERDAPKVLFSESGTTHFVGNGPASPISLYAALKVSEVLGAPAQWGMLEEFGHAPLFSLRRPDTVNAFGAFDPLRVAPKLARLLKKRGFGASAIPAAPGTSLDAVFHLTFLAQLSVLRRAERKGMAAAYLSRSPEKLAVSDSMIY